MAAPTYTSSFLLQYNLPTTTTDILQLSTKLLPAGIETKIQNFSGNFISTGLELYKKLRTLEWVVTLLFRLRLELNTKYIWGLHSQSI